MHQLMVDGALASDELLYLQLMDQVIREAALPYRKVAHTHPSVEERLNAATHEVPPPFLTVVLTPEYDRPTEARDIALARLGLAQVALLLKAYRAQQGAYPESLAELPGLNGRPLPTDPFSGKAFGYRRDGAGFLLYSWGPNLKDDGGKPAASGKRDEGGIVLRCVR